MPVMDGLKFLEAYKEDPSIRTIPTVVLTTSNEGRDRLESYRIGIAGFIIKPVSFTKFSNAIQHFDFYWKLCKLPP